MLNPTAVFCNDRETYHDMLAQADQGDDAALDTWSTYVLQGILEDLIKVDRLTHYAYLRERNMVQPVNNGARQYSISFTNNYLLRSVIHCLSVEGFIPAALQ